MSDKTTLSERIRPDCEAAPWVVHEVKQLETELTKLREENERLKEAKDFVKTSYAAQLLARDAEIKELKEYNETLEQAATSWMHDYDQLKAKYEPLVPVLSSVQNKIAISINAPDCGFTRALEVPITQRGHLRDLYEDLEKAIELYLLRLEHKKEKV